MLDLLDEVPEQQRADPLVSPAHPGETAPLEGIAPALVITAAHDVLRAEAQRYADRLAAVGALVERLDVPGVDHGYDIFSPEHARPIYERIAAHLRAATGYQG